MPKDEEASTNLNENESDYKKAHDKWVKEVLEPALAKHPERNKKFMTTSSQKVDRLYTPLDNLGIDFEKDIYGRRITVQFIEKIREEVKFDSIDLLKSQIKKDIEEAKKILD